MARKQPVDFRDELRAARLDRGSLFGRILEQNEREESLVIRRLETDFIWPGQASPASILVVVLNFICNNTK